MKHLAIWLIATLAIISCESKTKAPEVKEPTTTQSKPHVVDTGLVIGDPVDIGLQKVILFPVGRNYQPDIHQQPPKNVTVNNLAYASSVSFAYNGTGQLFDSNAQTEYVVADSKSHDIRNILFYNQKDGSSYSLLDTSMHILSFAIHNEFSPAQILYRIVKEDYNQDSIFDQSDPVMLFSSDLQGNNMTQLTPDNETYVEYFYYPDNGSILIKTAIDTDADSTFSVLDETNFREVMLKSPQLGREIFDQSMKEKLRQRIEL